MCDVIFTTVDAYFALHISAHVCIPDCIQFIASFWKLGSCIEL